MEVGTQDTAATGTGTANTKQVSKLDNALSGLGDNFDNFLTLLTTQMQNQDPLEPLDNSELTSQLVQFASVEQSIQSNQRLEDLIGLQQVNASVAALGYIGRTIETPGSEFELRNSQAEIVFELDRKAKDVTVDVLDKSGQVVASLSGSGDSGINAVRWDGQTKYGTQAGDGVYKYRVTAEDSAGEPVPVSKRKTGMVDGVDFKDGETVLTLGNTSVALQDILAVR